MKLKLRIRARGRALRRFLKDPLGGRPMKREGCAFVDRVDGREVNYYTDRRGRRWLANSGWSMFRVARR